MPPCKVLAVDDHEKFRRQVCLILRQNAELQVIAEASDGLEAVQKAEELQPDLILLDIGLPKLSGIEAAKRIRKLTPHSRILFLSQESSSDVVREALNLGALGYVRKPCAQTELLPAIESILAGRQFVGSGLEDCQLSENMNTPAPQRHEVQFYSDQVVFLERVTHFIAAALKAGNAAIVFATKPHRDSLLWGLKAQGVDVDVAIHQGVYVSLDAADTLSTFMVDDGPDPIRFLEGFRNLIQSTSKVARAERPHVAIFGEGVALLWAEGKTDAAIRLEQLGNDLAKMHDIDILCAYPFGGFHGDEGKQVFERICAEHSAVHSQ